MSADLIRAYYDAFNRHDYPALLALLAEDVAHDVNQSAREVGRDRFAAFLERMDQCYREQVLDLVVMTSPDGRRAAAEFRVEGAYLATDPGLPEAQGQAYSLPVGAFFEVADGRITRVTNYYNVKDWVSQVGS